MADALGSPNSADRAVDTSSKVRLSYRELAAKLGTSVEAARIKAKRRGWPIEYGNQGHAIVSIERTDLEDLIPQRTPDVEPATTLLTRDRVGERVGERTEADDRLQDLLKDLQEDLRKFQLVASQAAERAAAAEATATELRSALEHERTLSAELRADLRDLRRPWWVRWFSAGSPGTR